MISYSDLYLFLIDNFHIHLSSRIQDLNSFMDTFIGFYKNLDPNRLQLTNPTVGKFCSVKHQQDQNWYRALIKEVSK